MIYLFVNLINIYNIKLVSKELDIINKKSVFKLMNTDFFKVIFRKSLDLYQKYIKILSLN